MSDVLKEPLVMKFDGSVKNRQKFLGSVLIAVMDMVGESNTLSMVLKEMVKNIFDHAQGKGSLIITHTSPTTFHFVVKDEGTLGYDFDRCVGRSTADVSSKYNCGSGLQEIRDVAEALGVVLTIDTTQGFCYSGTYTLRKWKYMKQTTLCFCIEGENVLLGMKKKGFGAGKVNGYGGKIEAGETPRAAAIRELQEESGLKVNEVDLTQGALVHFSFEEKPMFDCFVFLTKAWTGELIETAEMKPEWHAIAQLPFASMWVADIQWLPLVLAGQTIEVYVNFNTDGSVVKEFSYKAAVFE